ncbi:F-box only protein 6-like isoform X2 [Zophobas morio]|uniref:F-box only protein 6-like isoform X2 n=1 Tax=Zophobas morio TaxID=2755281 RepID=UPI003083B153
MGNINIRKMTTTLSNKPTPKKEYEPVETFKFLQSFTEETNNGLYLNYVYFPEEVITMILSYVDPTELLHVSEVCKKWCNIIKSDTFWANIYQRKCGKKPKKLPCWTIVVNYGDQFRIEDPPCGADPLPIDVPEFNGRTSCFATSYYECNKLQEISLENNRLIQLILDKFKPHIYLSEWMAARFDCGCIYNLWCKLFGKKTENSKPVQEAHDTEVNSELIGDELEDVFEDDQSEFYGEEPLHIEHASKSVEQWAGSTWIKVEMVVKNYPSGVRSIVFQHEGRDTQFWKGHYGSKMAGGVVKILFDSIEPLI